jgi:hypothetical protein
LLAGLVYLGALAGLGRQGSPSFTGKAAFVTSVVAAIVCVLLTSAGDWSLGWAPSKTGEPSPSTYVLAACIGLFAAPATAFWILAAIL